MTTSQAVERAKGRRAAASEARYQMAEANALREMQASANRRAADHALGQAEECAGGFGYCPRCDSEG